MQEEQTDTEYIGKFGIYKQVQKIYANSKDINGTKRYKRVRNICISKWKDLTSLNGKNKQVQEE